MGASFGFQGVKGDEVALLVGNGEGMQVQGVGVRALGEDAWAVGL